MIVEQNNKITKLNIILKVIIIIFIFNIIGILFEDLILFNLIGILVSIIFLNNYNFGVLPEKEEDDKR